MSYLIHEKLLIINNLFFIIKNLKIFIGKFKKIFFLQSKCV